MCTATPTNNKPSTEITGTPRHPLTPETTRARWPTLLKSDKRERGPRLGGRLRRTMPGTPLLRWAGGLLLSLSVVLVGVVGGFRVCPVCPVDSLSYYHFTHAENLLWSLRTVGRARLNSNDNESLPCTVRIMLRYYLSRNGRDTYGWSGE